MPRFSIIIPTRARADTLFWTLQTACNLDYDDLEILVHECGSDPKTAVVVEAAADKRIRYLRTGEPVSMVENWERAVNAAAGQYLTVLGDDDGILPDACSIAEKLFEHYPAELLSWRPASYHWPKCPLAQRQNRLIIHLRDPEVVERQNSKTALDLFYRFRYHYSSLPMIYNSFVGRSLVERVRHKTGCYFLGSAPDVTSGIVNAWFSESFLVNSRPLSISGLSHNSTGHRMYFSGSESQRRDAVEEFYPGSADRAPSRNLDMYLAAEMMITKEKLFPGEAPFPNWNNLLRKVSQSLNRTSPEYESVLRELYDLGLPADLLKNELAVPQESPLPLDSLGGIRAESDGLFIDIDCSRGGFLNIHEAVRLLSAMIPPFKLPKHVIVPEPASSISNDQDILLTFGHDGNGRRFLTYGWGEPESWGVWSTGRASELAFSFMEPPAQIIEIRVQGSLLIHDRRRTSRCTIRCNGKVSELTASIDSARVASTWALRPEDIGSGEVVVSFEVEDPRSPAEDGVGADARRLGFALEEISIKGGHSSSVLNGPDRGTAQTEPVTSSPGQGRPDEPTYNSDNLCVWLKDTSFLREPRFAEAYSRGMNSGHKICRPAGSDTDLHLEWRFHVLCWAASVALKLPGDFVECGVNTGMYSLAVAHYIDFNCTGKQFFLFDTFAGIPREQISERELRLNRQQENELYYEECYERAKSNFLEYERAILIRGKVPDTLTKVRIDRVCYLSIDMNIVEPEIAALRYFWNKLVPGAPVVLDDYGWLGYAPQKEAMDEFAASVGARILTLPTGQGLLLKPPEDQISHDGHF